MLPVVRVGPGRRGPRRGGLTEELLRSGLEAAIEVARAGEQAVPPVPAPRAVGRLLQFARLPERALAVTRRTLDEDEAFRDRVVAALLSSSSEEAVGRPSWLFLTRPPGWEEELASLASAADEARAAAKAERGSASAVRRLEAAEEARGRAEAALAAARAEVAEVRARLADERRARALADTELGRLRARVAALEAEAEVAAAPVAAAAPPDVPEPALESEPEPVPAVDAGRVLAALDAAAGALADASALVAPFVARPTRIPRGVGVERDDGGRSPVRLPPATMDDTAAAAEFLVRVPSVLVLVDGYNVTKRGWPDLSLPEQRRWLLDAASGLAARTGAELVLVFDGDGDAVRAPADRSRRSGVQLRFSPAGVEADDVLLELAAALPVERPIVVASSDRRVQEGARRTGANVVSSDQLLAVLGTARRPEG